MAFLVKGIIALSIDSAMIPLTRKGHHLHPFPLKGKPHFHRVDYPLCGIFPNERKYRKSARCHVHIFNRTKYGASPIWIHHIDPIYNNVAKIYAKLNIFRPFTFSIIRRKSTYMASQERTFLISWLSLRTPACLVRNIPVVRRMWNYELSQSVTPTAASISVVSLCMVYSFAHLTAILLLLGPNTRWHSTLK